MSNFNFRPLQADEIECRVGNVSEKGISLLMYKNARVDMALLDEVVGPENWKRDHEVVNGNLFCTVSIRTTNGEWVSKQDVGTESNTEKEKGQASDAFKRACVNWGIGRELYTCPFVWINLAANEWYQKNGKKYPSPRFSVSAIEYDESRRVSYLVIIDNCGKVRYTYGKSAMQINEKTQALEEIKNCADRKSLEGIFRKHPTLANDQDIIDACTDKAHELNNQAA